MFTTIVRRGALAASLLMLPIGSSAAEEIVRESLDETGFVAIFDGKTLDGWHVSAESGHSRTSGNQSGGRWVVENGAIVGSQDTPGNGGIVVTDKHYGDFEIIVEMKNDYGPDSGLFLRSNDKGQAYQYLVDYRPNGSIAGLYGEGLKPGFHLRSFSFGDAPEKITEVKGQAPTPLPVSPTEWTTFWKHDQWKQFRARIEGNPPEITTWIDGVRFMHWQDDQQRAPDAGSIALQVHGGGNFVGKYVRYRDIRVKELNK